MSIDAVVLGKRLRQVRVANGFTQTDMAEKMGLGTHGFTIVSRIEKGQRSLSAIELHRWAAVCGSTSDDILNGKPLVIEAAS